MNKHENSDARKYQLDKQKEGGSEFVDKWRTERLYIVEHSEKNDIYKGPYMEFTHYRKWVKIHYTKAVQSKAIKMI